VTTLRPYFFERQAVPEISTGGVKGYRTFSVDLGHIYWNSKLDQGRLRRLLSFEIRDPRAAANIDHTLDLQAVSELDTARSVLATFSRQIPTAAELFFCFRVLNRCVAVASRHEQGLEVHLTRGIIDLEHSQYVLAEILKAAAEPLKSAIGQCLKDLLDCIPLPDDPLALVINLRNDGELNQAIALAGIWKRRWPECKVILDTSGANEQFSFAEWIPLLKGARATIGQYVDYFLPRQDYKASLCALLDTLVAGKISNVVEAENVICLTTGTPADNVDSLKVPPIEHAFTDYIHSLPVFYTAGQRTIVGRLSPAKCHWAACKFCTINSQHIMPRGLSLFDSTYQNHFNTLIEKIRADRIESVILMDEALHPNVLVDFARALLATGLRITYRARCRFTNDLSAEACALLYQSGCRYLGLGLESASPRVNSLVHKHLGAEIDYNKVLQNLEDAGIRMHIYAIMGFPTETKAEITATRDFLIAAIVRFRYLTVSANLFHLMRGSGMAQQPAEYGIEISNENGDVALVLDFFEPERARNFEYAALAAQRVYQAEFLPDIDDPGTAEAFWHFIDQTGIFYVQKVVHPKSPYHVLSETRCRDVGPNFASLFFAPSRLFWINDALPFENDVLCDWVTFNYATIPPWLRNFVRSYDPNAPLESNVTGLVDSEWREKSYEAFRALVEAGFFLMHPSAEQRLCGPPPKKIFRRGRVPIDDGQESEEYVGTEEEVNTVHK
jgi:hypothetical protein